jgi:replication factor C large subunit
MSETATWAEKYRPTSLEEYRGRSKTIDEVMDWVKNWENRKSDALLLHGPPGSGKTSLVEVIANDLGMELFETNASDVRTKQALKDTLEQAVKQRSFTGRQKLILIDEIDGMSSRDRGGRSEINAVIKESRFPVILTANDAYANGMQAIRRKSKVVELGNVHTNSIAAHLRDIAEQEGISYEERTMKDIARRAGGDMRSAINDLQSLAERYDRIERENVKDLGYRDTEKDIFEALKVVFKTMDVSNAKNAFDNLSEDHDTLFEWIRENVPKEYERTSDCAAAMDVLSKADVFRGRMRFRQNWSLLKYVYDLMGPGVALSKRAKYKGFTRYGYPSRIKKMGRSKASRAKLEDVGRKIGDELHVSVRDASYMIPFLQHLFENPAWRENIVDGMGLTGDELEFIEEF